MIFIYIFTRMGSFITLDIYYLWLTKFYIYKGSVKYHFFNTNQLVLKISKTSIK